MPSIYILNFLNFINDEYDDDDYDNYDNLQIPVFITNVPGCGMSYTLKVINQTFVLSMHKPIRRICQKNSTIKKSEEYVKKIPLLKYPRPNQTFVLSMHKPIRRICQKNSTIKKSDK